MVHAGHLGPGRSANGSELSSGVGCLPGVTTMLQVSTGLRELPPRFHLELDEVAEDPASSLAAVIADPRRLGAWIDADAEAVGAPDPQVSASMLVQHVSMVLGGATLAAALLHGALPAADPTRIHVSRSSATRWAFRTSSRVVTLGAPEELLDAWLHDWVDGLLTDLVEAVHRDVRVGRRMLWDNVASAAAANLVFLDWWAPQLELGRLAPQLAGAGSSPVGSTVTFGVIDHGGRSGLRSARRSCCLHFRCDPPHWCPTCPKLDETARTALMRTHLGHLDAVVAARS